MVDLSANALSRDSVMRLRSAAGWKVRTQRRDTRRLVLVQAERHADVGGGLPGGRAVIDVAEFLWLGRCGCWAAGVLFLCFGLRGRRVLGMACRVSELVVDCRDPERLAAFWCAVLGFVVLDTDEDGAVEIGPREGFRGLQPTLVFSPTSEPKVGKLRLHIDVSATDREQDDELRRLLELGARRVDVGQTGEESWHCLADPEGNEFCLLRGRLAD